MTQLIADFFLIAGLMVLTIGVYGVVRMNDVYTQLHAASKAGYLGVLGLLASAAVGGDDAIVARAVLIGAVLSLTTPVAAHAVGRAARRRGEPMRTPGAVDET